MPKISREKKIIKIRAEINELEDRKAVLKINKTELFSKRSTNSTKF